MPRAGGNEVEVLQAGMVYPADTLQTLNSRAQSHRHGKARLV